MYSLAKQILMTDKSLGSVLVFVSVALKHFTRAGGIIQLCYNICLIF